MVLAASAAHASPLETYEALDDACRGETPSPWQEKAFKARGHIEKMGYCYVMDRLALKASGVRIRLTAASIANDRYCRFSDSKGRYHRRLVKQLEWQEANPALRVQPLRLLCGLAAILVELGSYSFDPEGKERPAPNRKDVHLFGQLIIESEQFL